MYTIQTATQYQEIAQQDVAHNKEHVLLMHPAVIINTATLLTLININSQVIQILNQPNISYLPNVYILLY